MLAYIQFPSWLKPQIIPGLPFHWYGLMYLVAFAIAYFLFKYQVKDQKLGFHDDDVLNFFFWSILGLLLGARILATTVYDPTGTYLRKPWLIFWPFDEEMRLVGLAGMSFHGGVLGCIVAAVIVLKRKGFSFFQWTDMAAAGIPLGYTFGRLGNFINGELWGRVTPAPWGMVFPRAPRLSASREWVAETARKAGMEIPESGLVNLPRHPSQLYEAFFEGVVLWAVLWFLFRKRKPFHGFILSLFIIGYGIIRFVIEYFRQPDSDLGFVLTFGDPTWSTNRVGEFLNFSMGQLLSAGMVLGGAFLLLILWIYTTRIKPGSLDPMHSPGPKAAGK